MNNDNQPKIYLVGNTKFRLKELTLNESEQVNKLISSASGEIKIENNDSKKFLSLVLEPVETGATQDFDFGQIKESTAVEVLKDFFTNRLRSGSELKEYFSGLQKELNK